MFSVDHPPTPGSPTADKIIIILFLIDPHRVWWGGEGGAAWEQLLVCCGAMVPLFGIVA